jgi:hypothetical protein
MSNAYGKSLVDELATQFFSTTPGVKVVIACFCRCMYCENAFFAVDILHGKYVMQARLACVSIVGSKEYFQTVSFISQCQLSRRIYTYICSHRMILSPFICSYRDCRMRWLPM